jgi:hypothetical protein
VKLKRLNQVVTRQLVYEMNKMKKISESSRPKSDFLDSSLPNWSPQSIRLQFLLNNLQFSNNSQVSKRKL